MLKKLLIGLAILAGLAGPVQAAGTITMSLTQRFDNSTARPLSGGKIYFIQAGTTSTPQNAFQDSALTLPYANPLTLDSGGNVPQLFFADGVIKVRITNSLGVQQLVQDNIQVTGASSGGGGGGTVDPTTILATGDHKIRYGTGVLSGFVRANGRTIGSASSGASERANADCQALFEYLWGADANLTVSTGRGASANADWVANKTLTLPDARGRVLAGLDDMGNSAASRYTGATFLAGTATTLGATPYGASIAKTNIPSYTFDLSGATVQVNGRLNGNLASPGASSAVDTIQIPGGGGTTGAAFSINGSISTGGSGTVLQTFSPSLLLTMYLKL